MAESKTIDVSAIQMNRYKNAPIGKKLTKEEQKQLDSMFDESALHSYFLSKHSSLPHQKIQIAKALYAQRGTQNVVNQIQQGQIQINQQPNNLDSQFLKRKISLQEQKALDLKLKKAQIQQKLKYLEFQTSTNQALKNSRTINPQFSQQLRPPNVLSKEEHAAYMDKIIKSRQERDKKHKQAVQKLEQGIKNEEMKLKQLQSQKMNKQKQRKRKQIEKSLQKKKQQHQKAVQLQLKSRQQYKAIKNKQFLHQKIEAKYQSEVLIPALQQKKKKLREIRELKAFNVQQLIKHEKQYMEKRNQSFSIAKSKANQDWNYKPPQKMERLTKVLEEQKLEQRKKLQQKKRLVDQKIQRQTNFVEYLKERFSPTVDQNKQRQIQQRMKIISKPKRRQSQLDPKTIGISYLQEAKKKKKQKKQRPQTERNSDVSIQKNSTKGMTDYLSANRKQREYYEQKRRKRLQNLIVSQNSTQMQKIVKLKRENDKINEAYSRKSELAKLKKQDINEQDDALELLLSGIKAKMGIINLYNHNQKGTHSSQLQTL